jgi:hypothetical protein
MRMFLLGVTLFMGVACVTLSTTENQDQVRPEIGRQK